MDTTQHSRDIYIQFRTDAFSTNHVHTHRSYSLSYW